MGRIGLLRILFAVLSGLGGASLVGLLVDRLPAGLVLDWQMRLPQLFTLLPILVGALVALAHIFWLRGLLQDTARRAAARAKAAQPRTQTPGERWMPEIRN